MKDRTFTVLCPFGGSGGGALGFLDAEVRLLGCVGRFRCLGSIDFDREACDDFARFTGSDAWCVDVETITPAQVRARYGPRAPDVVFMSPPCKGSSRLLSKKKARTAKYRRMNRLAVVWTQAMLDAWRDSPPPLVLLENVPGLPQRARPMLRSLRSILREAGYVFHASTHDCGEVGGLAQHRERYLLVARHPKLCPPLLYQPPKRRVRACGEVLSSLPIPATVGARAWGMLHALPRIEWRNWLRLALIPAGGDWRDLPGVLAEEQARREKFRRHAVARWDAPIEAVTGPGGHSVGAIADPRPPGSFQHVDRVRGWDEPVGTVTSSPAPSSGRPAVADPRVADLAMRERAWGGGTMGVTPFDAPAGTVAGESNPANGRFSVADPRVAMPENGERHWNKLAVAGWGDPAGTVIGKPQPSSGGTAVADPRLDELAVSRAYDAGYGVLRMDQPARAVAGTVAPGTGAYAVADGRERVDVDARVMTLDEALDLDLPLTKAPPFVPVIVARDGTWHRPLTLLELAVLQGYPLELRGEQLRFAGKRTAIAEHIGNSVPPPAARAIAERMLATLIEAAEGGWSLATTGTPVWVEPSDEERASA